MRIKSELWVKAYLRRCAAAGMGVYVTRRGDSDAGVILIKVDCLNGNYQVYGPAIESSFTKHGERRWQCLTAGQDVDEHETDTMIAQQVAFDPDIWVIAVEDRQGDALLTDTLVEDL